MDEGLVVSLAGASGYIVMTKALALCARSGDIGWVTTQPTQRSTVPDCGR